MMVRFHTIFIQSFYYTYETASLLIFVIIMGNDEWFEDIATVRTHGHKIWLLFRSAHLGRDRNATAGYGVHYYFFDHAIRLSRVLKRNDAIN